MNESQVHRGPDGHGLHLEPGVGLGHRRLSIIDIAAGQQPMYNDDRSTVVVYNGEIYNFRELRTDLAKDGFRFRTDSDTEVILRAWEAWGEHCVDHLRGMFAFAIWHRASERLFLARDRVGIKPLHYAVLPTGLLLFASELKALLVHPDLPRMLDPQSVEDYFAFGFVPEPRTILKNVFKLPPGHVLAVGRDRRELRPHQYWNVRFQPDSRIREPDAIEELETRLRDSVDVRLVADVPLGAFLSGGVDSSSVVTMMAGLVDKPVKTCSMSFDDPRYDEIEYARGVAKRFNTDHHDEQVAVGDFELAEGLSSVYDEPFADSSAIPTYRLCELARKRVTVALSGDGGDEVFGGYRRYRWFQFDEGVRSLVPRRFQRQIFGVLGGIYPKLDWAPGVFRARETFQNCSRTPYQGYLHTIGVMAQDIRSELFSSHFRRELQGYNAVNVLEEHARDAPSNDPISLAQYLDFKVYLPGDILTKVDRSSMAHSLEVRVPMLDHHLIEWAATLPANLKLRGREGKYILKKAMERHLPSDVLYRPKMGFAVPISSWFRGALAERMRKSILGSSIATSGIFEQRALERLVDEHTSGLADHGQALWSLFVFQAFYQRLSGESVSAEAQLA